MDLQLTAVEILHWSKRKAVRPTMCVILEGCIDCAKWTNCSSNYPLHDRRSLSYITTSLLTDASLRDVLHRNSVMDNHYMMCVHPGVPVKALMRSVSRFSIVMIQRGRPHLSNCAPAQRHKSGLKKRSR